jgi:hypothetical protein
MPFGTTVQAYTQKPSKPLQNYQVRVNMSDYGGNKPKDVYTNPGLTSLNQATPASPAVSAGAGRGSNVPTGGMQSQQFNPVFQPTVSGNFQTDKSGQAYSYLNEINRTSDILNEGSQAQLDIANAMIRRRNAMRQQQATYDSGYANGGGGFAQGDSSSFAGGSVPGLSDEQMNYARQIASIGRARGLDDNAIQIAIMTSLAESEMKNINHGDRDSLGLFQQRPSQGWGTAQQITNPTYSINKFYEALQRTNYNSTSPWLAAQAVQRSFDPTGNNYRARYQIAQQAFRAINNPAVASVGKYNGNAAAGFINAYNNKYIDYDGAFGNQCVDLYDYYTTRFVGGAAPMVGFAPEIYNNYDTKAYARTGANVPAGMGYVAIFRPGGYTPSGHVAIVVGDNGNGTLRVLQSNATPAGPRGNTIISNISKSTLMGYLIPRKLMR